MSDKILMLAENNKFKYGTFFLLVSSFTYAVFNNLIYTKILLNKK